MTVDIPPMAIYNTFMITMQRMGLILACLCILPGKTGRLWAADEQPAIIPASPPEVDQTTSNDENEDKGVIPPSAEVQASTQPLTPISPYIEKTPYEDAQQELIQALSLYNAGKWEASSDAALEAYDDLTSVHRVPGIKRSKLRSEIHQAATVYVQGGIKFIVETYKNAGKTASSAREARERLEDLRDVARNYRDLNRQLDTTLDRI